jgi:hypothetical protein
MFVRLTKPVRAKAGWFAALLYLFCMLAPGVALAFGDAASCLTAEVQPTATTPMPAAHVHAAGASHWHGEAHQHHADTGNATPEHAKSEHGKSEHAKPEHAKHQHDGQQDGKASHGPCCTLLCLSAIAADLPAIAKPAPSISAAISENFQRLPGKAPPLLYRPPIA